MFKNIEIGNLLKRKEKVYCISIDVMDSSINLNGMLITGDVNQEFHFEKVFFNYTLEQFLVSADNNFPIILNISGNGITTKVIENQTGYLQKLLFKANIKDFYICEKVHEKSVLISFCRTKTFDHYYEFFNSKGFYVIHFSMGPVSLLNLLSLYKLKSIGTPGFEIRQEADGMLQLIKKDYPTNKKFILSGEEIPINATIGLSDYFSYKSKLQGITNLEQISKINQEEVKFKYHFKRVFSIIGSVLVLSAGVGHFWKKSLQNKFLENQEAQSESEFIYNKILGLNSELKQKEEIFRTSGFKSYGFFSKHISLLTQEIPQEILLNKLVFQPISGNINSDEIIEIQPDKFLIEGLSNNDPAFKNWIRNLEKFSWIRRIEVLDYARETNRNNKFTLEINL